jgi:hypothetical protein
MITVGYGDITPKNYIELSFTIVTMFFTGMVWAYSLNSIGNIIENLNKTNMEYKSDMLIIHNFMREENICSNIRAKVSNYIEYFHKVRLYFYNPFFFYKCYRLIYILN